MIGTITHYETLETIPEEFFLKYPALRLIGNTDLVELTVFSDEQPGVKISAKAEWLNPGGSVKDRPVLRMIAMAMLSGELREGQIILDSSSGNAGIAYSMIGAILGIGVEIVVPGNASRERIERIKAHGATVIHTDPLEGYDEALREAHRRYENNPDKYFLIDQYSNEENWKAHYYGTAEEIIDQSKDKITHFVSGVGTGGSITGIGRRLKEYYPGIKIVMVNAEPFPGIEGLKPLDEPDSIIPQIFDASLVDEKIDVSAEDSKRICAKLASHGFFVGQSSGAYLYACGETAKKIGEGHIVTLLPDMGERYFSAGLWS
ncbi:MAG: PLP-dependent cysteine synthase family protein [Candidatus Marinimicrobia bacterium]|nr:PLP-dependent cysteine synthase family protein [Candidatus Neomarinimicrobiota bacterium]